MSSTTSQSKILIVDDDLLTLVTLTASLAQAGYEVLEADNADDAILLAHHFRPKLALLDMRMQGRSHFDVARYLREHLRIPFVLLAAATDAATLARAEDLGATACILKPQGVGPGLPRLVREVFDQASVK
jgi:response regulator NasT